MRPSGAKIAARVFGPATLLFEIPSVDAPTKVPRADDAARAIASVGADLVVAVADVAHFRGLPRVLRVRVLFLRASAAARIRHMPLPAHRRGARRLLVEVTRSGPARTLLRLADERDSRHARCKVDDRRSR